MDKVTNVSVKDIRRNIQVNSIRSSKILESSVLAKYMLINPTPEQIEEKVKETILTHIAMGDNVIDDSDKKVYDVFTNEELTNAKDLLKSMKLHKGILLNAKSVDNVDQSLGTTAMNDISTLMDDNVKRGFVTAASLKGVMHLVANAKALGIDTNQTPITDMCGTHMSRYNHEEWLKTIEPLGELGDLNHVRQAIDELLVYIRDNVEEADSMTDTMERTFKDNDKRCIVFGGDELINIPYYQQFVIDSEGNRSLRRFFNKEAYDEFINKLDEYEFTLSGDVYISNRYYEEDELNERGRYAYAYESNDSFKKVQPKAPYMKIEKSLYKKINKYLQTSDNIVECSGCRGSGYIVRYTGPGGYSTRETSFCQKCQGTGITLTLWKDKQMRLFTGTACDGSGQNGLG